MPLEIRRDGFPQMHRIEAAAARDHNPGAVFNPPPQKIGTFGLRPKRAVILKLLQHRPRKPELRRQQTIKAYTGLKRNHEIDLRHGPVGRFIPYLFRDIEFGKLVDALGTDFAPVSGCRKRKIPASIRRANILKGGGFNLEECGSKVGMSRIAQS